MKRKAKRLLRSLMVNLPFLQETKTGLVRWVRASLRVPHEDDFRAIPLFNAPEGALFLDVGANAGQSADAILMSGARVRLQLFEPNELLCRKLERLYQHRRDSVTVHCFGLGDSASEAVLYVPFYKGWMFTGLASFDPAAARSGLSDRFLFYRERHAWLSEVRCRTKPLDELGLAPYFIKIDTEGYEYQVLRGGAETLRRHEPILLIESATRQISEFLAGIGYEPLAFRGGRFHPNTCGRPNTFYMTPAKRLAIEDRVARPR